MQRPGLARGAAASSSTAVLTVALIVLTALALRPPFTAVAPLLPEIQRDLGVSTTFGGVLTTLPVVCLGVFAFAAPRLRQRFGEERVLAGAMALLAGGHLLRALGAEWSLLGGTVVVGSGVAVANVIVPGLIKRDFPDRVASVTALYTALLTLGGAVAASVVVPIGNAFGAGWRLPLGLLAVPVLLACLLAVFSTRGRPGAAEAVTSPRRLWRHPLAWQITVFMGLQSGLAYVVFGWLPTMLQSRGVPPETAGVALGVQAGVQAVGASSVGLLLRWLRDQRVVTTVLGVLIAGGFTGVLLGPGPVSIWTATVVLGCAQGAAFNLAVTLFGLRAPDSATTAALSGMAQGGGYLIAGACPLLIGVIFDLAGSWVVPLCVVLAVCASWMAMGMLVGRPRQVPSVISS